MLSQLFDNWQGGGDEQKYRSEVCWRFRGEETHHHGANGYPQKGWSKAEWQFALHDPSYSGSGVFLERSTAIQSKGACRCERERAARAFLSGLPMEIRNGHHQQEKPLFWGKSGGVSENRQSHRTPRRKQEGFLPLGRASIAFGYTALVPGGDCSALTEPVGENGRSPPPPKPGERQNTSREKGQKTPPISEQDKGGMRPEAVYRRKTPSGRAGRQVKGVCWKTVNYAILKLDCLQQPETEPFFSMLTRMSRPYSGNRPD